MKRLDKMPAAIAEVFLMILYGAVPSVVAQGMVTDRPDFTESAVTVPMGVLQFEGGATYSNLVGDLSEIVVGEALLRWGLNEEVEMRVGAPSFISFSNGDTHSGLGDGSIGAKVQLGPVGKGWDVAAIASVSMPIGDDEFSSGRVDPTFVLTTGRALDDNVGFGGQVMASWPTVGDDREFEWGGTAVVSSTLGSRTGAFVELAATFPEAGTAPIVGHTGLVYAVSNTFQLDIHAGLGLTDTAPDVFLGVGLAGKL